VERLRGANLEEEAERLRGANHEEEAERLRSEAEALTTEMCSCRSSLKMRRSTT
jgi:hypothetical protein